MNIDVLTVHLINSMCIFYLITLHAHIKLNVNLDFLFNSFPLLFFPLYGILVILLGKN